MRRNEVEDSKRKFENHVESWKIFGMDLVDSGSPNPCSRSANARKVLSGRWQQAYEEWLSQGEFSRPLEELYLGFILATEAIFHRRPSAPVPENLPKRVWSDAEYQKSLRRFQDIEFRNLVITRLLSPGNTPWVRERNEIGALVKANQPAEAERLFYKNEWDQNDMAESYLALIRTCKAARSASEDLDAMWFFAASERRGGPVSFSRLKSAFMQGELLGNCLVWREGMNVWKPAGQVKCFAPMVYTGALPPPLP